MDGLTRMDVFRHKKSLSITASKTKGLRKASQRFFLN
jgi:hypothetical protein